CQLNKVYLHDISDYNRIVNQRNNLLKQAYFEPGKENGSRKIWWFQAVLCGFRHLTKKTYSV
ncbi:MAG: DNA replication and repair protein RecF, partial [Oscillospiraceae bacterium]|nr:DNA replication and repair protein RecF [Oscillospiraceae bacterium]